MTAYAFHILKMNIIAAAAVCAVIFTARLTRKKYSAKWKYYMWIMIAVFLLLPADLTAISPVRLHLIKPQVQGRRLPENAYSQKSSQVNFVSPVKKNVPENDSQASRGALIPVESSVISLYGLLELFAWVWPLGVAVFGISKALRYRFSLWTLRRWSYPVSDAGLLEMYREVCREKHVVRPPRLLVSPRISTPVLAGLKDTGLYLTENPYETEELRFILRHELSHYRRKDLWYKMLLLAVSTLYWFNPALLWMQSEAEKDIENLCDGTVVEHYTKTEKMHYGRLLLKTAAFQNHVPYLSASLNDSTLVFKERLTYMSNIGILKDKRIMAVVLGGLMAAGNVVLGSSIGSAQAEEGWKTSLQAADSARDFVPAASPQSGRGRSSETGGNVLAGLSYGALPVANASSEGAADKAAAGNVQQETAAPSGASYGADFDEAAGIARDALSDAGTAGPETAAQAETTVQPETTIQPEAGADPEAAQPEVSDPVSVNWDDWHYLWSPDDYTPTLVFPASDGSWFDREMREFVPVGDGQWSRESDGSIWSENSPQDTAADAVNMTDEYGNNPETLYLDGSSGIWHNIAGGVYTLNPDGTFTGPDGTVWYPDN